MSAIDFPEHVIVTRCKTRTNSSITHGRHGVIKRVFTRAAFSRSTLPIGQWTTTDGHLYTSVPVPAADIPQHYTITSRPYGKTGKIWTVLRDGVELPLAFYLRKRDAQERIKRNAAGKDTINVA